MRAAYGVDGGLERVVAFRPGGAAARLGRRAVGRVVWSGSALPPGDSATRRVGADRVECRSCSTSGANARSRVVSRRTAERRCGDDRNESALSARRTARSAVALHGLAGAVTLFPFPQKRERRGSQSRSGGRLLLVEAVAQTTHRSGASICDRVDPCSELAKMARRVGRDHRQSDESRCVSHQFHSEAFRPLYSFSPSPSQAGVSATEPRRSLVDEAVA